jgi:hypothetical protein
VSAVGGVGAGVQAARETRERLSRRARMIVGPSGSARPAWLGGGFDARRSARICGENGARRSRARV